MQGNMETFSLALKINSHQLKLDIQIQDDQDSLFEKVKKVYPQCTYKKRQVLTKFKQDLQRKIQSNVVKPELKAKIEYFLKKTFQGTIQPYIESSQEKNKGIPSQETKSNSFRSNKECNSQKDHLFVEYNLKKAPQYCPTFKKQQRKPESKQISRTHSEKKKQCANEDVVKACQVIMQKTNQNDMKQMARKYLEEVGRLPSQSKKKEKIIVVSTQVKKEEEQENKQLPIVTNEPSAQSIETNIASLNESKSHNYRSPIAALDREAIKPRFNMERSSDNDRTKWKQAITRNFRGNRYDYLSSIEQLQVSKQLMLANSYYPSLRNSGYRQKKFTYLLDFNS